MSTAFAGTAFADSHSNFSLGARSTRVHLTRRGRVVLTLLASAPLVIGAFFFAVNAGDAVASSSTSQTHFEYVTVQPGQSLWSIAEKVAPSSDPRDVIANIVALNQLQSGSVLPGQRIAIPAQYATSAH